MITFNLTLHTTSGLTISTGAVTVTKAIFQPAIPVDGSDPIRSIVFETPLHNDVADYLSDYNRSKIIEGEIVETVQRFVKQMTPAEHAALMLDGTLAEQWLQTMIEAQSGIGAGNTTISDPYAV